MSDLPADLDLKFLPDWLKEGSSGNRYADYEGESDRRSRREEDDRGVRHQRGPRRDGPRPAGRGDNRDPRGKRTDRPRGDRRAPQPSPGDRRSAAEPRNPTSHDASSRQDPPAVRIEFLPEPNGLAGIARQIKTSGRAYPLFGTARLFLERPERHRVRITSLDPARPLFHLEDGPVSFDRTGIERNAFRHFKADFYAEEVVQGEPIKGNYTNVARSRTTRAFLGPTNYHGYQPALRKLFEERFSRRMSFAEFQQQEIEIVTGEQAVNDWKEQTRSSTKFTTLKESEPITFKSLGETEQHFREQYLPALLKQGVTVETSGQASRASGDRAIANHLRECWEKERGFPANLVNHLRPHFIEAGLHFFKHRKRILYVSGIRPQRHATGQVFSEGIAAILNLIESIPHITRPQLAGRLLGEHHDAPEAAPKKAALASDLHYLIHAGHVIEFHDGTLDLPLSPKAIDTEGAAPVAQRISSERPQSGQSESSVEPSEPAALSPNPAIAEAAQNEPVPNQTGSGEEEMITPVEITR